MTCAYCGEEFFPTDNRPRRYCCKECRDKNNALIPKAHKQKRKDMLAEWAAWKHDFALGKTASNFSA